MHYYLYRIKCKFGINVLKKFIRFTYQKGILGNKIQWLLQREKYVIIGVGKPIKAVRWNLNWVINNSNSRFAYQPYKNHMQIWNLYNPRHVETNPYCFVFLIIPYCTLEAFGLIFWSQHLRHINNTLDGGIRPRLRRVT